MWNIIYSNKIIERIAKEEKHSQHLRRMHQVKSCIKNTSGTNYTFL